MVYWEHLAPGCEPSRTHLERDTSEAIEREVFPGVDLHLEPQVLDRQTLGGEPELQGRCLVLALVVGLPQPGLQNRSQAVENRADGATVDLNEVDVLAVPLRRVEVELVKGGTPTKGQGGP